MIVLILATVASVALETVPLLWQHYQDWFVTFEVVSLAIFTVEYLARVWVSVERDNGGTVAPWRSRLHYMVSPLALVDLAAILPFYLIAGADLRFLRIFRLLRLLKLVRYSPGLASLGRVVYAERRALLAAFIVMMGLLFFASSAMYFVERSIQPDVFGSIPQALWWALATFTTVGYGDVVPITPYGKMVGGVVMIFGLAFYALPIGIIASGFSDEVHRREFVVPTGVIAEISLFRGLSKETVADIAARLRTLMITPGTVVTQRRDEGNGLYFVMSGEISVFYHQRSIQLGPGDFFGETGLISENGRQPACIARSKCRLLWLEHPDLHMLMTLNPQLIGNIRGQAEKRLTDFVDDGLISPKDGTAMLSVLSLMMPDPLSVAGGDPTLEI